jgi:hypothetical protein
VPPTSTSSPNVNDHNRTGSGVGVVLGRPFSITLEVTMTISGSQSPRPHRRQWRHLADAAMYSAVRGMAWAAGSTAITWWLTH